MRYRKLGNTGLIVSEMCLGAMTFGSGEGMWATVAGVSQDGVTDLIKSAFDRGINFIDTADFYSNGRSEVVTGNALKMLAQPRDSYVLATKVLLRMGPGHNQIGLSRYHIMENIDASLKRLQVDHIDLYQIHGRDPFTPLEETLDALDDCVRAGKVRYTGLCNLSAWEIMKSMWISDRKNLARFESLQMYYSLAGRDIEREIVPLAKDQNLEPARRRIPLRQIFARERKARWCAPRDARFPAGGARAAVAHPRRAASDRRRQSRVGGAGGAGLVAGAAARHLGDHRREERAAAARQHRGHRARAQPRTIAGDRRSLKIAK
jgi:aryl-alcohol dehydrogenase-like predicted oxidoreductase